MRERPEVQSLLNAIPNIQHVLPVESPAVPETAPQPDTPTRRLPFAPAIPQEPAIPPFYPFPVMPPNPDGTPKKTPIYIPAYPTPA